MKKKVKLIVFSILGACLLYAVYSLAVTGFFYTLYSSSRIEVNTNIKKYNKYMFENAKEKYRNKWDMNEDIFPRSIKNLNVIDYKMVYYDPWDKQFLSYLVIDYDKNNYDSEVRRLKEFNSTDYIGYFGVTGFSKYKLLAMYADSYNGFVYAITDNKSKIIYVELIFCNYFYDLDYQKYIDNDYLPDGFDATIDNSYMKEMTE